MKISLLSIKPEIRDIAIKNAIMLSDDIINIDPDLLDRLEFDLIKGKKSKGLGDTIAKITHATGLNRIAVKYSRISNKPCNCSKRQDKLNELVPYD